MMVSLLSRTALALAAMAAGIGAVASGQSARSPRMTEVRFMTLDPGHFHAGLVQKEMIPGVARRVDVYAPLGADLLEHLNRIRGFNTRAEAPTSWELEVHTGPD